jgi:hypothetical protein
VLWLLIKGCHRVLALYPQLYALVNVPFPLLRRLIPQSVDYWLPTGCLSVADRFLIPQRLLGALLDVLKPLECQAVAQRMLGDLLDVLKPLNCQANAQTMLGANRCLPMPTDAYQCLPMPTDADRCQPMPTDAGRCRPMPTDADRCQPMPTDVD